MSQGDKTQAKIKDEFVEFLKIFQQNSEYKYRSTISSMPAGGKTSMTISFQDLLSYNVQLATELMSEPFVYIAILGEAVCEVLTIEDPKYADKERLFIRARVNDLTDSTPLRALKAKYLGRLVSIEGLVTRSSELIPLPLIAAFRCPNKHVTYVDNPDEELKVRKPARCETDGCSEAGAGLVEDRAKSIYADSQVTRVQEKMEDLPPGQFPRSFDVRLSCDLVDSIMPGDRVRLVGYLEVFDESKTSPSSRFRLRSVSVEPKSQVGSSQIFTPEEVASFRAFAAEPGAYQKLTASIAPSVYGHELLKEAALLLLTGSPAVTLEDGTRLRGEIHVLFAGDPGLGKTTILIFVCKVSPRGIFTDGRGSTAAGLTAAVVRDKNGVFNLEAGATVLGDQGVTSIDEMSRMRQEDRAGLHVVMEQGIVSIAKAGFNATLNARTSILGATNPVFGKWDPYKSLEQNLSDFPIPLLNRFDLIFIVRDEINEELDSQIADHILSARATGAVDKGKKNFLDVAFLRKYLAFGKTLEPKMDSEVKALLKQEYLRLRRLTNPEMIPFNPRSLESLMRLSIAKARSLLHPVVTVEDASRAIYLMNESIKTSLVDPGTNKVDPGITYGKPLSERGRLEAGLQTFKDLSGPNKEAVEDKVFIGALEKTGKFNHDEAENMFKTIYRSGQIYPVRPHFYKRV
jgi:replicative DNA helicase Mcm